MKMNVGTGLAGHGAADGIGQLVFQGQYEQISGMQAQRRRLTPISQQVAESDRPVRFALVANREVDS
jgi:hypothetical protein